MSDSSYVSVDALKLNMPGKGQKQQQQTAAKIQNNARIGDPQGRVPVEGEPITFVIQPWFQRLIWAPFPNGEIKWKPYLLSLWLEFYLSFFLSWTVSAVASVAVSGSTALNALSVGLAYGLFIMYAYSWRQFSLLPRHLNPALTWAELVHAHVGLSVAVPYWACQFGGSALSAVFLSLTGSSAIPNYATALRPVSYWGAMGLDLLFGFALIYTFVQNLSVEEELLPTGDFRSDERSRKYRGIRSTAILSGLAALVGVLCIYPNGLYALGNTVVYFGSAINLGFNVPESGAWTIYVFWSWLGGILATMLHWLTWDVNDINYDENYVQSLISMNIYERQQYDQKAFEANKFVASMLHVA